MDYSSDKSLYNTSMNANSLQSPYFADQFSDFMCAFGEEHVGSGLSVLVTQGLCDGTSEAHESRTTTPVISPVSHLPFSSIYFADDGQMLKSPAFFSSPAIMLPSTNATFQPPFSNWNSYPGSVDVDMNNNNTMQNQDIPYRSQSTASVNTTGGGIKIEKSEGNHQEQDQTQAPTEKGPDDGYNWRKYGQKHMKGSDNPRSYYKCTHPRCSTKKKVESTPDGHVLEIVYKGSHNHERPLTRKRSHNGFVAQQLRSFHLPNQSKGALPIESVGTMETSLDSGFDEHDPKRWKEGKGENEECSYYGSGTVKEPRIVVQTTSSVDLLDDGYRWRKYGQKVVKGNPNPRSYYKCTTVGCPVRKYVERSATDSRSVITTYEGKHTHDVPAPRRGANRVAQTNNNIMANGITRPCFVASNSNNMIGSGNVVDLVQSNGGLESMFVTKAKEEQRDDMFLQSFLYQI